jgi:multidrug efflux pump subunit AcrA (membrane-fusion protein)
VDFVADGIALLAFVLSLIGFIQARSKAKQAADSARAAESIARESQLALEKSAEEASEANRIARATLPPSPWDIELLNDELSIRNASDVDLFNVTVRQENGDDLTVLDERDREQRQVLRPNQRILLAYSKTFDSPAAADLIIQWRGSESGTVEAWYETLS